MRLVCGYFIQRYIEAQTGIDGKTIQTDLTIKWRARMDRSKSVWYLFAHFAFLCHSIIHHDLGTTLKFIAIAEQKKSCS